MILHQMISVVGWLLLAFAGVACIVRGAEIFAEHHSVASVRLGVSSVALALLLAGTEPEELAAAVVRGTARCAGPKVGC
jgi:cation:H+ antiporter